MSDAGEPGKVPPSSDDKQQSETQDSTRRRPQAATSALPPQPHELTAEWTVRAQLTFARAGEKVQREFSANDPVNPVRVVYKWSTFDSPLPPDDDADIADADADLMDDSSTSTLHQRNSFASRGSRQSTPLKTAQQHNRRWQQAAHESFRSTTSSTNADLGGGDSAFSGSNASKQRQRPYQRQTQTTSGNGTHTTGTPLYGTRCRSTCNIVVSAVADFLPTNSAAGDASTGAGETAAYASSGCGLGGATTHVMATATDLIPEEEPDPFVFNTTASYTVLPQRSIDSTMSAGSKNLNTFGKMLALRDAFSQTSDTETKYFEEQRERREYERRRYTNSRSPLERRTTTQQQPQQQKERKSYEQRRATTEGLLQTPSSHIGGGDSYVDEANSYMPSFLTSPSHTFKSASMPRIPTMPEQARAQQLQQQQTLASKQKSNSSEPLKKPRTVHIDVYCTGSEDEDDDGGGGEDEGDHADAEASSDASHDEEDDASKRFDLESNSTPQTVFDNEQLLLKHKRITGQALPRRLQQQQPQTASKGAEAHTTHNQQRQQAGDLSIGHAITKSSTAEEVSESKQLLFRKHIGDQRAAKLAALRQKYMRQPSDDAISSNYPNSSRSTVRDATCSSIASSVVTAEYADSSWKETEDQEEINSLAKSDSFEYENTTDRLRIKQMERFWSRTSSMDDGFNGQRQMSSASPVRGHMQGAFLQPISEVSSQRNSPYTKGFLRNDTLPSESEVFSETSDNYYTTYPGATPPQRATPTYLQQTSHFPRNRPGFLQFFGPSASPSPQNQMHPHISSESPTPAVTTTAAARTMVSPPHAQLVYPGYQPHLQRWKSETRDNLSTHGTASPADRSSCGAVSPPPSSTHGLSPSFQRSGSEAPPATTSAATFHQSPMIARRFEMKHDSPAISEASTTYSGYTAEYLLKAKKFGPVVSTARKPGHHVGPTKNPNCACESCQRWLAERFQVRSRAFSLGERPILRRPT
ncbi:unnamed protein product [Ceratitis capitata]|uniref:(Mediterranean fruit fly) hypothetical protein n=1 Tax=Ceratitis capitata TaxID=7213 RepID=A0A811VIB9_CERCA|nr:unnamed protein product [Ceratitis capitata]